MTYGEWSAEVPCEISDDALWTVEAYRLALFLGDICWHDATKLTEDKRTLDVSDQLYRATGSVSANTAEGYSRWTGKDRARFYGYALGSARESRDWYFRARHVLGPEVASHRMRLLVQIIRLLITMIPQQRAEGVCESEPPYGIDLSDLLTNVPLP